MKKVSLLLFITMILVLAFSSCTLALMPREEAPEEEHEHVYDDFLSYDSEMHFYACECGEYIDEEEHEDKADNDGLCDACGFEMYVPITLYTVSIVASDGVTVSDTAIKAEKGSVVTFTATIDEEYYIVVTGAFVAGEPTVVNGAATYTLAISSVKSDVTVAISCEPIVPPCEHNWSEATCDAPKTCGLCGLTEGSALGHNHVPTVTAPTCMGKGYTTYTCERCGDSYVEDEKAALGHIPGTAADCNNAQTCTVCGDTLTPAFGHKYTSTVTAPTCTDKGYTTYTCSVCGDSYVADEKVALGHTPGAEADCTNAQTCTVCGDTIADALGHNHVATVTAPTCTDKGYTTYTCSACGDSYVADEKDALGHNHVATVTAPTCTDKGYTTYTCSACGDSYVADEKDALGHNHVATVTAPTCTDKGYTTYTCSGCADTYVADEKDALGHNWKEATCTTPQICYTCKIKGEAAKGHSYNAATCTEPKTCASCGRTQGNALGHDWEDATCDTPKTCKTCGAIEGDVADHKYESVIKNPTCTEGGYTTHTCSACGDTYTDSLTDATGHVGGVQDCVEYGKCTVCGTNYIDPIGHSYSETVKDPTCDGVGYTTHVCANCGDTYIDNQLPALGHSGGTATCEDAAVCEICGKSYGDPKGHSYETSIIEPSCTEVGYTLHSCINCGSIYKDTEVAAKGHKNTSVVTPPGCTEKGYTTYTCSVCGAVSVGDETEPVGHKYETQVVDPTCTVGGYTAQICSVCGDTQKTNEVDPTGHSYSSVVTPPTCTAEGYTTYTCHCGDSYVDDTVAATGHTWVDATTAAPKTCSVCGATEGEPLPQDLIVGENVYQISTDENAQSLNIKVQLIGAEVGKYRVTTLDVNVLAVFEGVKLRDVECYEFEVTEDNLSPIFTVGNANINPNRTNDIYIVVEKVVEVIPDPDPIVPGGTTISGTTGEDKTYYGEVTITEDGAYIFTADVSLEGIALSPDGTEIIYVTPGEAKELTAGTYMILVQTADPSQSFNLTYVKSAGVTISGTTGEDGAYYGEITITEDGAYIFTVDVAVAGIALSPDGTEIIYVTPGEEKRLTAGTYMILVQTADPSQSFNLTYVKSAGVTISGTTGEDGAYYGEITITEDGAYIFTVDVAVAGIALSPDGTEIIYVTPGEAKALTAGTYMILVQTVDPNQSFNLNYA